MPPHDALTGSSPGDEISDEDASVARVKVGTYVDERLWQKARAIAFWDRKHLTRVLEEALTAYIENKERERGKRYKKLPRESNSGGDVVGED